MNLLVSVFLEIVGIGILLFLQLVSDAGSAFFKV